MSRMLRNVLGLPTSHPFLFGLLVLVLLMRAALPEALRWLIVKQSPEFIAGRLEVGDVDLWLVRGAVAVRDVAVVATGATEERPVALDELYVDIGWLDLLHRTARFQDVRLRGPRVAVARLDNGGFDLAALIKPRAAAPTDSASPEDPAPVTEVDQDAASDGKAGWTVGVDRFVLENGRVAFHDQAVSGEVPIAVEIARLQVAQAASRRGLYEQAGRIDIEARVLGAPLTLRADFDLDPQVRVSTKLKIQGLPLQHAGPYSPVPGWSGLRGGVDADLEHELEVGHRNEVRGSVAVRGLAIEVPDLDRPALAWESLAVKIAGLDLLGRRVKVEEVDLRHLEAVLTPRSESPFPLLAGIGTAAAAADANGSDAAEAPASPEAGGERWGWSVGRVGVDDAHLFLVGTGEVVDLGLRATAREVEPGEARWPLELEVRDGDASVEMKGSVRLEPVGFAGTLEWKDLLIPRLVVTSGLALPVAIRSGQLDGKLEVAAGMDIPDQEGTASAVRLEGMLGITQLGLSEGETDEFALDWQRLAVEVSSLLVPGALGGAGSAPTTNPIVLRVKRIELEKPNLRLTRTPAGLVLPTTAPRGKDRVQLTDGTDATGGAADRAESGDIPTEATPGFEAEIAQVELTHGKLTVVDKSISPPVRQRFSGIRLTARDVGWPARQVDELSLEMTGPGKSQLSVKGHARPGAAVLELVLDQLGLQPLDPYAATLAGYGIKRGSASLKSRVQLDGDTYKTENQLVFHRLGVSTKAGDTLFRDQFGVPLALALSLMSDVKGNITLDVPVGGDHTGARVGVRNAVLAALRRTIVNALSSPLKLVGKVVLRGDKIESVDLSPASFRPGRDEPDQAGLEQLGRFAALLSEHPALTARLEGRIGAADVRQMREQALLETLERNPSSTDVTPEADDATLADQLRVYLRARTAGEPVEPEPAIQPLLEDLLSRFKVPAPPLRELAAARAARARAVLEQEHSIDPARLEIASPSADVDEQGPIVRVEIGTAS